MWQAASIDSSDVKRAMGLGADGVQVATRFVTTEECDAEIRYKQAYINASKEDIMIVKQPGGHAGTCDLKSAHGAGGKRGSRSPTARATDALQNVIPADIPYCITVGLINAVKGNIEKGLLFCGAKAWKAEKIDTVRDAVQELFA